MKMNLRLAIFAAFVAIVAASPVYKPETPPTLEPAGFSSTSGSATTTAAPTTAVSVTTPPTTASASAGSSAPSTAAPAPAIVEPVIGESPAPEVAANVAPATDAPRPDAAPTPAAAPTGLAFAGIAAAPTPASVVAEVAPATAAPTPAVVDVSASAVEPSPAAPTPVVAEIAPVTAAPTPAVVAEIAPIAAAPTPAVVPVVTAAPATAAPVAAAAPAVTVSGDRCNFRFCVATPTTFAVGQAFDTPFTGAICKKDGTPIGTIDQSGEASLEDGTKISQYKPAGLKQNFSPSFFKTFSIKPKHLVSGIGHETPQQNQGDFLNGKTFVFPVAVYQVLNSDGHVIDEVVAKSPNDCIKFSTSTSAPAPTPAAPTPVAPTPVAPTPVAPTPVAPTPVAPTPEPVTPPVTTSTPAPVAPGPKVCKFRFCAGTSSFTVGGPVDTPFTGKICKKDGTPIGTIDESGEAALEDGTPISKYSPAGLTQNFSPTFFRTSPIKATKYVYSGVAHQLPQQNQAKYLDGKTWVLPLKAYQTLNAKGHVTAELVGGDGDCVKFTSKV